MFHFIQQPRPHRAKDYLKFNVKSNTSGMGRPRRSWLGSIHQSYRVTRTVVSTSALPHVLMTSTEVTFPVASMVIFSRTFGLGKAIRSSISLLSLIHI